MGKKFCPKCGTEVNGESRFCHWCGEKLEQEVVVSELSASDGRKTPTGSLGTDGIGGEKGVGVTLGEFRQKVSQTVEFAIQCRDFRKNIEDRWDYNAVAGILVGSKARHVSGKLHFLEQHIGIGQGDNGNHVVLKLQEKGLESVFTKYEANTFATVADAEADILAIAPEYKGIIDFINGLFLKDGAAVSNDSQSLRDGSPSKARYSPVGEGLGDSRRGNNSTGVSSENSHKSNNSAGVSPKNIRKGGLTEPNGHDVGWEDESESEEAVAKQLMSFALKNERAFISIVLQLISMELDAFITGDYQTCTEKKQSMEGDIQERIKALEDAESVEQKFSYGGLKVFPVIKKILNKNDGIKPVISACFSYLLPRQSFARNANYQFGYYEFWEKIMSEDQMGTCMDFLRMLSEEGYGGASYVLSQCYANGIAYSSEKGVLPDYKKQIHYLNKALGQKWGLIEVCTALGCDALRNNDLDKARKMFRQIAWTEDAKIYLRYIDLLGNRNQVVESYRALHPSNVYIEDRRQRLRGDFVEYKGCLYYCCFVNNNSSVERIIKYNPKDNSSKILLEVNREEYRRDVKCMDRIPTFAVTNDTIYFSNAEESISCMDLEGKNRKVLVPTETKGARKGRSVLLVTSRHFLYTKHHYGEGSNRGILMDGNKEVCDAKDILGLSEKEVLISVGKKEKQYIFDLDTCEKRPIEQVYVGLKGVKLQNLFYVDMALEIAYYIEGFTGQRNGDDYLKIRIIGINKKGEIVDVWHLPKFTAWPGFFSQENICPNPRYSSMCFDGHKLSVKVNQTLPRGLEERRKELDEEPVYWLLEFDRFGNGRLKCTNDSDSLFGRHHGITGDIVGVLQQDRSDHHYYATAYLTGEEPSQGHKMEFFT